MSGIFFLWILLNSPPGELVVVEHAILDGRLPVHLVHIVIGEPEMIKHSKCARSDPFPRGL